MILSPETDHSMNTILDIITGNLWSEKKISALKTHVLYEEEPQL